VLYDGHVIAYGQDSVTVLFSVLWKKSLWWGCADASAVTDDSG